MAKVLNVVILNSGKAKIVLPDELPGQQWSCEELEKGMQALERFTEELYPTPKVPSPVVSIQPTAVPKPVHKRDPDDGSGAAFCWAVAGNNFVDDWPNVTCEECRTYKPIESALTLSEIMKEARIVQKRAIIEMVD